MSESDLLDMFSGLHPSTLKQGGSYIVYNIHEDNVIRARVFNLKRGTLVFVDANGRPILKISCGNPMIAPTPKVALKLKPGVSAKPHPMPTPGVVPAEVPTTEIMPPTPIAPPPVVPAQPIYEKIVSGNVYESKSTSSLFVLPLLLFINTHSKCCDTQKQPVPEPASMLVMGFGASWMMLRKRRKNHAKV